MNRKILALLVVSLAGCATYVPNSPTVAVMPAPGKPFEVFMAEDQTCRAYAYSSAGSTPGQQANDNMASSMIVGTAVGAAAGALIGGNHQGAGAGAGMGLLMGTAVGSNQANYGAHDAQWRYNTAYSQCMYSKGNQVPGYRTQQFTAPVAAPQTSVPMPPPPPPPSQGVPPQPPAVPH